MHRVTVAVIFSASLFSGAASAQDLRGWCYPVNECMGEQIPVGSGSYNTCEETCTLTNPVPVRGMEATLYDEVCQGDWMENGSMTNRIMFITLALSKIYQHYAHHLGQRTVTKVMHTDASWVKK